MSPNSRTICKVLIIDDDPLVREFVAECLEIFLQKDDQIFLAENGERGLEIFLKEVPTFVIVDIKMESFVF